ncbi:MAG: hypothetical protein Tp164SUR323001_11 [Prokaryotic dsDNA virus sp.]|nr:MAG: hypothetical protein Tp164SUR323001_11 [Prokaryotic dsDNA virus sp.]|tara:strand:+ start:572 stop:1153 length:582 start_codon:yes stop_codon:yes gene_type:complete
MGVYNLNYSSGMAQVQNIFFYENISSLVEPSTLTGKYLLFYFRGRKTNWIRSAVAYPTANGDYNAPEYTNNDRCWTLRLTLVYPTSSNIASYDGASTLYRLLGNFVPPINETFDIDVYYNNTHTLNINSSTKIEGLSIVLNVTVDETFGSIDSDLPISYFTEYTNNDLKAELPISGGKPYSNNEDNQYGTITW